MRKTTKAIVLKKIKIRRAKVPYLISFPRKVFNRSTNHILNKISKDFKNQVAVRSSGILEDQKKKSYAGHFKSFLNIEKRNRNHLKLKINEVFNSFNLNKKYDERNEVIIQDMVNDVVLSGVATSCDKDNFTPYYIINFSKSNKTSDITSGNLNGSTFVYYFKSKLQPKNIYLRKVIFLIKELKTILGDTIDIEFAGTYFIKRHKVKAPGVDPWEPLTYYVMCIDGHKFIHQLERPVVQIFEERDGKSLPAKC